MKREVKFKRELRLKVDGEMRSYRKNDLVELEEVEALRLIKAGLAVPGRQTGPSFLIEKK